MPALVALFATGCVVREDEDVVRLRFSVWGSTAQLQVERDIIAAFESAHPDIRVDVVSVSALRYQEKIQAMMVGGIAPDVMMVRHTEYDDFAVRGALADVTDLQDEIQADLTLLPGPRRLFERGGRFFALPVNGHGFVTFVNLDAFAAAGIEVPKEGFTWEQIETFGPQLSRRSGTAAAPTDYAMLPPGYAYPLLAERGGAFFDDPYHPTRAVIDSPAGAAWIRQLRSLEDSGYCAPRAVITDLGTYQLFRDGRVALYFNGRWQVPDFLGISSFRWDVRPFPAGPAGRITWHGGTAVAVSSKTRHPQAARAFARFYAGRRAAEIAARGGRTVPVYRELADSAGFLALRPPASLDVFVATMDAGAATSWLCAPGVQEVWDLAYLRIEEALADRSVPEEVVVRRLAGDLTRWLERQRRKGMLPSR